MHTSSSNGLVVLILLHKEKCYAVNVCTAQTGMCIESIILRSLSIVAIIPKYSIKYSSN